MEGVFLVQKNSLVIKMAPHPESCYSRQKMARFLPQKPALPSLPSLGKGPLSSGRGLACFMKNLETLD